jgi:G3E family GTPase
LLKKPEAANTAVIVNEFGEVGIDDALLRSSSDATVLLGNGCLCCAVRTDLQETLRTLFAERGRGAAPNFERVIIETSGLADPGPVLQNARSAISITYRGLSRSSMRPAARPISTTRRRRASRSRSPTASL